MVKAAREGAAKTAELTSSKGRASYIGDRARGYEDPGATAVAMWLEVVEKELGA